MAFETVPGSPASEHAALRRRQACGHIWRDNQIFTLPIMSTDADFPAPRNWGEDPGEGAGGDGSAASLPEPKYQAFRHDLLVASFHPGHRAKWTAHELCHALVGFAFRPGAPVLFHALGAWLAEFLPVALWYFFDEAGLQEVPRHQARAALSGALRRVRVGRAAGPDDASRQAAKFIREGEAFVKRELAAITRSTRRASPWHTLRDASTWPATAWPMLKPMARVCARRRWSASWHFSLTNNRDGTPTWTRSKHGCSRFARGITEGKKVRPWSATRWDYAAQDVGLSAADAARAGRGRA